MNRTAKFLSKKFSSHLLIKILPFLFMLKVGNELLDGLYHLCLGKVFFCKDPFQLLKEAIHLIHLVASGLANNTQSLEPLHINLLTWNIELLVCLLSSRIRTEVYSRILQLRIEN